MFWYLIYYNGYKRINDKRSFFVETPFFIAWYRLYNMNLIYFNIYRLYSIKH